MATTNRIRYSLSSKVETLRSEVHKSQSMVSMVSPRDEFLSVSVNVTNTIKSWDTFRPNAFINHNEHTLKGGIFPSLPPLHVVSSPTNTVDDALTSALDLIEGLENNLRMTTAALNTLHHDSVEFMRSSSSVSSNNNTFVENVKQSTENILKTHMDAFAAVARVRENITCASNLSRQHPQQHLNISPQPTTATSTSLTANSFFPSTEVKPLLQQQEQGEQPNFLKMKPTALDPALLQSPQPYSFCAGRPQTIPSSAGTAAPTELLLSPPQTVFPHHPSGGGVIELTPVDEWSPCSVSTDSSSSGSQDDDDDVVASVVDDHQPFALLSPSPKNESVKTDETFAASGGGNREGVMLEGSGSVMYGSLYPIRAASTPEFISGGVEGTTVNITAVNIGKRKPSVSRLLVQI